MESEMGRVETDGVKPTCLGCKIPGCFILCKRDPHGIRRCYY
jgi:hypothetical protein